MATGDQLRAARDALNALENFRLEVRLYPAEHAQVQAVQDLILREKVAMIAENEHVAEILRAAEIRRTAEKEN